MAEILTLTDFVVPPTVTSYRVAQLTIKRLPNPIIQIRVVDNLGNIFGHIYDGDTAKDFINQLNTMNFTNTSLENRILQRLSTDGILVGTVSGTPGD